MTLGAFALFLHCHIPYCRLAGRWPHGEEWLHEALLESYIPLLDALYDLRQEGVPFQLSLDITPILAEQLADEEIQRHFLAYAGEKISRAAADEAEFSRKGESHRAYLAAFFGERYQRTLNSFTERYHGDVLAAFRCLRDEGLVEIATSAATHAYLPLLERDSSIYAQLVTGIESYRHHFGRRPHSIWLPECGYRPAFYKEVGGRQYIKPGLEEFLAELGIGVFFAETHSIERGTLVGKAAGDVHGPYGQVVRRYVAPTAVAPDDSHSTAYGYWVGKPGVAVLGRESRTGLQVWSAKHGYPGDYCYREFHKKAETSGLQYWRVTGADVDLGGKDYYYPERAARRVAEHSQHFASLVEELVLGYSREGKSGIVFSSYDAELFGHWWFEGIEWLKQVLRHLSRSPVVQLMAASRYVEAHPPEEVLSLPESSWGLGGGHFTWYNGDNQGIWFRIREAETKMESLAARSPQAEGALRAALNQLAREKLLLESSDWTFLVFTGQAKEYAIKRFNSHLERFHRLSEVIERGQFHAGDLAFLEECQGVDNPFPQIDYRHFAPREPSL